MRSRQLVLVTAAAMVLAGHAPSMAQDLIRRELTDGIDQNTPAAELFLRAYEVFSHPRCSNCHPRDDRPRWGARVHGMNVQRGPERPVLDKNAPEGEHGRPGLKCQTCHQEKNGELAGSPPGARNWRLAPSRMGWAGMTAAELCLKLKNVGGDDLNSALKHIVDASKPEGKTDIDPLVEWAWTPGPGRESPPGNIHQFVSILQWWRQGGAACPSDHGG